MASAAKLGNRTKRKSKAQTARSKAKPRKPRPRAKASVAEAPAKSVDSPDSPAQPAAPAASAEARTNPSQAERPAREDAPSGPSWSTGPRRAWSSSEALPRTFPGISPRAYEHPADRAALVALRKLPAFDLVLRKLHGLIGDRSIRLLHLASAVRVGPRQFRTLNRIYEDCLYVLDMPERPELFVTQTPFVNAGALGLDKPIIVLNSGSLAVLDEAETRVLLGHELAHVLSGHALYKTMLHLLVRVSNLITGIPLGSLALFAVIAALREWERKSELSADRAGLLVTQDPELNYRVQMKMAGGSAVSDMDLAEFMRQVEEYDDGGNLLDNVVKVLNLLGRSHPFHALRVAELKRWAEGGDYARIMRDEYPRRADDPQTSVMDEIKASARSYTGAKPEESGPAKEPSATGTEGTKSGSEADPLATLFENLGTTLSSAGEKLRDFLNRRE